MKRVLGCIRRADRRYNLLQSGDHVMVAVSGGKDSMLLMEGLALYKRYIKMDYTLSAAMIDIGLNDTDKSQILAFAEDVGVPLNIIKTDIGDVVFNIRQEKNPCALCAKLRRGALCNAAKSIGANKIALGHNREDVIETLFLSLLYESRMNTFAPYTYLSRMQVSLIRPFVFLSENYVRGVVNARNIPILPPNCPVAGKTKREEMKELIKHICTLVPDAKEKMINAIADTQKYRLWDIDAFENITSTPEFMEYEKQRRSAEHDYASGIKFALEQGKQLGEQAERKKWEGIVAQQQAQIASLKAKLTNE